MVSLMDVAYVWSWSNLFIALVSIALLDGIYLKYWHPLANYPGPFWASVTNLWRFITFFGGQHHLVDQKLHAKYGPAIRTGPNSLSFSTLAAYESIYGHRSTMEKGNWYQIVRDAKSKHSTLFGIRTNEEHRPQRKKVLKAAFASSKVSGYRPIIEKYSQQLIDEIQSIQVASSTTKINMAELFHHYTFGIFYEIVFGEPVQCDTPADRANVSETIRLTNKSLGAGYLPWLGSLLAWKPIVIYLRRPVYKKDGRLMGFSAVMQQSLTRVFTQQEAVLQSIQSSFLQNFLLVSESDDKLLSPRITALETMNTLFAGVGSTAAVLTAILYQLAQPDGKLWQARIRQDCAQENRQTSHSLVAIIKETLRTNPSFPSGFPRTTTTTTTITVDKSYPEVIVPRNTNVSCNLYVLGRSRDIWGSEAEIWNPERWLGRASGNFPLEADSPEEESSPQTLPPEEKLLAFGKGPRSCIGKEIAMVVLGETIAKILQNYDVRSCLPLKGKNFFEMQYSECLVELVRR